LEQAKYRMRPKYLLIGIESDGVSSGELNYFIYCKTFAMTILSA